MQFESMEAALARGSSSDHDDMDSFSSTTTTSIITRHVLDLERRVTYLETAAPPPCILTCYKACGLVGQKLMQMCRCICMLMMVPLRAPARNVRHRAPYPENI